MRSTKLATAFGAPVEEIRDVVLLARMARGDCGFSEVTGRVQASSGDARAQNAVAIGVVDHDLSGRQTASTNMGKGEVRAGDYPRHSGAGGVMVDV